MAKRKAQLMERKVAPKKRTKVVTTAPRTFIPRDLSVRRGPLPSAFNATLRYYERFTINPGSVGTADNYVFSLNGLYDPNVTGVGHQPRGFDELMPLFNHYCVTGGMFRVNVVANSSEVQDVVAYASLRDGSSTSSNLRDYMESGQTVSGVASHRTRPPLVLEGTWSMNRFFGMNVKDDDRFRGSSSSNPTEQLYLHVGGAAILSGADPGSFYCTVELVYRVTFMEPNTPAES